MKLEDISGFLFINKSQGMTSFDCIKHVRRILGKDIRIGHAGTLDPFATGLLIIAVNRRATRHINVFMEMKKEYIAQGKLGELTDTLDATGAMLETQTIQDVTNADLQKAIRSLGNQYLQIPPIYSALKYKGEPLYKLARTQKISVQELQKVIRTKQRMVELFEMELVDITIPYFTIRALVSHGTYVRSLINDIAQKIDVHATMYSLCRTKIGSISLDQTIDLNSLKTSDDIQKYLAPIEQFVAYTSKFF